MVRRRTRRLGLGALLVVAGAILAGGLVVAGGGGSPAPGHLPGSASLAATTLTSAVVPARTEAGTATAADPSRQVAGRWLVPLGVAVLGLAGLPGRRQAPALLGGGRPPLRARRHCIALRAPPSLLLA